MIARAEIAIILHNIRSAYNVGSIFRTADAVGVIRMYLTGYTPTPRDRFERPQKEIAKTALGAETHVPWEYAKNPTTIIKRLKKAEWHIVGVEQDTRAENYRLHKKVSRTVLVFGNEIRGLSLALRRDCDTLIEIPMHGKKESLNVSVAAGIVLFSVRD
ncbi:TrmH family RNA methyltransferase [Candidatus Kaiserbacteria bacterium]|nr:TrmH family RNA methyltransferase [Candidatus Kaiserbacteria bacterium]